MTTNDTMEAARMAIEALEAEGFVLMASKSGTSFLLQSTDTPARLDENGRDVRSRFILRLETDQQFRAAVKDFILTERPYGAAV